MLLWMLLIKVFAPVANTVVIGMILVVYLHFEPTTIIPITTVLATGANTLINNIHNSMIGYLSAVVGSICFEIRHYLYDF